MVLSVKGSIGLPAEILARARVSRDPRFDGRFFIAVKSTRIYCRPICPARTSKEANVCYFASAAEAAEAGYRPCLRCRPEAAPGSPAWAGTSAVVARALRLIQDGALDHSTVAEFAAHLGIGERHLTRLFSQHVGASPNAIAQTRRLHLSKRLLDETDLPITQIAHASGFRSLRRFNEVFQATYRRAPREIRKRSRRGKRSGDCAQITLRLPYRPPYDWEHMEHFLRERALPGIEQVDGSSYARSVRTAAGPAVLRVTPLRAQHCLELRASTVAPGELLRLMTRVRRTFDLTADPVRISQALHGDSLLSPLITRRGGFRIPGYWDLFECGIRVLLGQDGSVAWTRRILGDIIERCGERLPDPQDGVTHLFPTAAALAGEDLANLGLNPKTLTALGAFAQAVRDGVIPLDDPTEQTLRAILRRHGVRPWVMDEMVLHGLGDIDAFPWRNLSLDSQAGSLSARALRTRAEAWRPFRGYAFLYLTHAAERPTKVPTRLPTGTRLGAEPARASARQ
jgi:AraC family transcriptional regulator of adaptative response / DNA-3-methyladenine glycosylase II